jgi:CO/xanthine dehydrogenase FAD-binding subunit
MVAADEAVDDEGHCTRVTFGDGGAAPVPVRFPNWRKSGQLESGQGGTRAVAQEAAAALEPESDIYASAAYRRHLAGVLAARVLLEAYDAARALP